MNHPAVLFRRLSSLWRFDAGHPHLEALAADLAASLAGEPTRRCIGLVAPESAEQLRGLADLLSDYGLVLIFRCRQRRDAVFVFADKGHATASEGDNGTERAAAGAGHGAQPEWTAGIAAP